MNKRKFVFFWIFLICAPFLFSQEDGVGPASKDSAAEYYHSDSLNTTSHKSPLAWYRMFTKVPKDLADFSKFTFSSERIPVYTLLAASTGALMMIDERGWKFNKRLFLNSYKFHRMSDLGVDFGDEKYHLMLAGLFTLYGFAEHNPAALKTAGNVVEALIASGISVQLLKRFFCRESPAAATRSSGKWQFFTNPEDYQEAQPKFYAFPSGHITTLSATITVIANNFPKNKWIKPAGYTLVGICGIGLVSRGMHWYSDLPFGFFLGYTFGNLVAPVSGAVVNNNVAKNRIRLAPYISGSNTGISFLYNF